MAQFPGAPLRWIDLQFADSTGAPLASGKLYSYEAGTSTPLPLYSDVDLVTAYANPVVLDADGRPPDGPVFMLPQGYKFLLADSDDVQVWSRDDVSDPGQVFAETFGNLLAEGGRNVATGYTVLDTDRLVTVDSSGATIVNLLASADATQPVVIKNVGAGTVVVTPDGSDTLDTVAGTFTIPAAATPTFPCIEIVPDGVSGWWIRASHGL